VKWVSMYVYLQRASLCLGARTQDLGLYETYLPSSQVPPPVFQLPPVAHVTVGAPAVAEGVKSVLQLAVQTLPSAPTSQFCQVPLAGLGVGPLVHSTVQALQVG
jgi:hypothetical protein